MRNAGTSPRAAPQPPAMSGPEPGLRLPPHSVEAEQSLLGGLMLDASAWLEVAERVSADDFYRPQHRLIFGVVAELAEADEPVDNVTVRAALSARSLLDKAGGADYLVDLVESTPGASNVAAYAGIVRERATLRRLLAAANGIASSVLDPEGRNSESVLDEAEREVFAIRDGRATEDAPRSAEQLVVGVKERLEYLAEHGGEVTGVASGFADLDRLTAGFQPADLVVVAARPSMGKTALMVNMAEHAVLSDEGPPGAVLVFSLEQPADQVVSRMLSSMGRIDQTRMRTGDLEPEDWDRFARAMGRLRGRPLYVDDTAALTPSAIRARARRVSREAGGLRIVMVDYLQLMSASTEQENRTAEISEVSRSLKALAKELRCPVVACSQLNRSLEQRQDKRPRLSDLRESGAIEQDADVILFIYRDEVYDADTPDRGLAEIIVGKQRNGPIGEVRLAFTPHLTRFDNHASEGSGRR